MIYLMERETNKIQKNKNNKSLQEIYSSRKARLTVVIFISLVLIGAEVTAAVLSHSIAVISCAVQVATDLIAFLFSLLFLYLSRTTPNIRMTFGYHRLELFGGLFNLFVVWVLILYVVYESILRILNKEYVEKPLIMLIGAGAGFLVNLLIYRVLYVGKREDYNLVLESECDHPHKGYTSSNLSDS